MSEFYDLIAKGKKDGYVKLSEALDVLLPRIRDTGLLNDIMRVIEELGIKILNSNSDAINSNDILASISPREAKALRMKFGIGINTDHTLEGVGKQFETRKRIREIEKKALKKLRERKNNPDDDPETV